MINQNIALILLGGLFLFIVIVGIFMRSRGKYFGDIPTKKKLSDKQALIFIIGYLILMIFTIYQKGHGY